MGDHLGFIRKLTELMVPSAVGLFADTASIVEKLAMSEVAAILCLAWQSKCAHSQVHTYSAYSLL